MELHKIVITGGPCGGKSSARGYVQSYFEAQGYTVLFVPETATELITGGVAPWTCGKNVDHQKCQMRLQTVKEDVFAYAASTMPKEQILMICDRGTIDNCAYMNDEEFAETLAYLGEDAVSLRDRYDAVFHLVTAANGAEAYYTTENNAARTETVEEAIALDNRVIAAWTGHPHFRIIDNSTDFKGKMRRLIEEIEAYLSHFEIERKFLIKCPDIEALEADPCCHRVELVQTYLTSALGEEVRIRQRGEDGHFSYYKTVKIGEGVKRIEAEERIDKRTYLSLMRDADPDRHPIYKTRYYYSYDGQSFEIDLYPSMPDEAIVEIELYREDQEVRLPASFTLIREVTGDPAYKNHTLAKL